MEFFPGLIDKSNPPCWIWIGAKDANGIPRINSRSWGIHCPKQYIYSQINNIVCTTIYNSCENPLCVNPTHLQTQKVQRCMYSAFLKFVEKTDSCWLWKGAKDNNGYGRISKEYYGYQLAHRYSYHYANPDTPLTHNGQPVGLRHICDNKCVNPDHLLLDLPGQHNKMNGNDTARAGRIHNQRLSHDNVKEVRQRIMDGARTGELTKEFGCSKVCIADLKYGRTWDHAEYYPIDYPFKKS